MTHIKTIHDIDTSTAEGKLLMSAIIELSNTSLIPKTYNQILEDISEFAEHMYGKFGHLHTEIVY